jgi:hypothetical protein
MSTRARKDRKNQRRHLLHLADVYERDGAQHTAAERRASAAALVVTKPQRVGTPLMRRTGFRKLPLLKQMLEVETRGIKLTAKDTKALVVSDKRRRERARANR